MTLLGRPRKVGRVPFGRAIVVLQLVAALTFLGYTAAKKNTRLPLISSEPFELQVMLPDAKGLVPSKEPSVGVAGAPAGRVTKVTVDEGRARVTMRLDDDFEGKVFRDASVYVRPTSVLQTLIVNIDPGTPQAGRMRRGATIPAARTGAYVHIDELTGTLDADTQAQIQVLVREVSGALDGREPELRQILAELGRLTDDARPLAEALDERRTLLTKLVDHLDVLLTTTGDRGNQLAGAIELGDRTLAVTERRAGDLEDGMRELAPVLQETRRALASGRQLAKPLTPVLDDLVPIAGDVRPAVSRLRKLNPDLNRFVGVAGEVARDGAKPARQLAQGLTTQSQLIENDQNPALRELIGLVELLERNREGVIQFARNISGATSLNRNGGTMGMFSIMNFEASAAGFGFAASQARSRDGEASRLSRVLAETLERTCRQSNPAACLIRFQAPGLSKLPVIAKREKR
jgi:phospholipid/cholesterol/gamma-HCH transport system substrate-binding protein